LLLRVVIPAALSPIFSGMRVALSISFTVLVAAELAGAQAGLGYLVQTSALSFRVEIIFVGIVALALLGFLADTLFITVLTGCSPGIALSRPGNREGLFGSGFDVVAGCLL
jgi:ABC-type nitrate/sulfonate/bicarbonate transport system permease component